MRTYLDGDRLEDLTELWGIWLSTPSRGHPRWTYTLVAYHSREDAEREMDLYCEASDGPVVCRIGFADVAAVKDRVTPPLERVSEEDVIWGDEWEDDQPESGPPPQYECDQCGACCRHLIIEITHLDVVREPKLRPPVTLLCAKPGEHIDWDDSVYRLAVGSAGGRSGCPMLGADNRCTIYPTRPGVCVGMEAGSEQCQDSRRAAGLAPLRPIS
jgi:Fe-S-cluster containining protein